MKLDPIDPEALLAQFHKFLQSWERHDLAARHALFDPRVSVEDPVGEPPRRGVEALEASWSTLPEHNATVSATLVRFIVGGNEALAHYRLNFTPPASAAVTHDRYDLLEFGNDLLIRRVRAFVDGSTMLVHHRGVD
jgi:SnoaL-like domain